MVVHTRVSLTHTRLTYAASAHFGVVDYFVVCISLVKSTCLDRTSHLIGNAYELGVQVTNPFQYACTAGRRRNLRAIAKLQHFELPSRP